jgi:hypothetical protein
MPIGVETTLASRNIQKYFFFSDGGAFKKFKNLPLPLFRPRSTYACYQSCNPSRDPVPLMGKSRETNILCKGYNINTFKLLRDQTFFFFLINVLA